MASIYSSPKPYWQTLQYGIKQKLVLPFAPLLTLLVYSLCTPSYSCLDVAHACPIQPSEQIQMLPLL